jgi:DNA mismatch repair ATPase MutS
MEHSLTSLSLSHLSLSASDDMEHNLSTFLTEMRETAYLLDHLSPRRY